MNGEPREISRDDADVLFLYGTLVCRWSFNGVVVDSVILAPSQGPCWSSEILEYQREKCHCRTLVPLSL